MSNNLEILERRIKTDVRVFTETKEKLAFNNELVGLLRVEAVLVEKKIEIRGKEVLQVEKEEESKESKSKKRQNERTYKEEYDSLNFKHEHIKEKKYLINIYRDILVKEDYLEHLNERMKTQDKDYQTLLHDFKMNYEDEIGKAQFLVENSKLTKDMKDNLKEVLKRAQLPFDTELTQVMFFKSLKAQIEMGHKVINDKK